VESGEKDASGEQKRRRDDQGAFRGTGVHFAKAYQPESTEVYL
jgi:hypothetical protein